MIRRQRQMTFCEKWTMGSAHQCIIALVEACRRLDVVPNCRKYASLVAHCGDKVVIVHGGVLILMLDGCIPG